MANDRTYSHRTCPTAVADEADRELTLSASTCHIGGPNSNNPGQILLVYGKTDQLKGFSTRKVSENDSKLEVNFSKGRHPLC